MPYPARLRPPSSWLPVAALGALSCSQSPSLLLVTLQNIDPAATEVQLKATLGSEERTYQLTGADLANQGTGTTEVALRVAPEHQGALQLDVAVKKSRCVLQSTRATVVVGGTETASSSIQLAKANVNACTLTVNVAGVGGGTGTVTSTPAQLQCPGTCVFSDTTVDSITLTATAAAGPATQVTWNPSTGCTSDKCTIPISKLDLSGYSVTATFDGTPPNTDGCTNVSFQPGSIGAVGNTSGNFRGIWASSDRDVHVAGDYRYTRFDSAQPAQLLGDTPAGFVVRGIWGTGKSNVWMAGDMGHAALDDGSNFTQATVGNGDDQYYGVWGNSFSNFYIAGSRYSSNVQVGVILQFNGSAVDSAWTATTFAMPLAKPLHAIWGLDDTTMVAVGDGASIVTHGKSGWVPVLSTVTTNLAGVFGNGTDIYAVGAASTVLRSSDKGQTWSLVPGPSAPSTNLNAVWADSHRLITVGQSGTIWCLNLNAGSPATWRVVSIGSAELRAVFGTSTKVFAVGDNRTYVVSPL